VDVIPQLKEGVELNHFPTLLAAFTNQATLLLALILIPFYIGANLLIINTSFSRVQVIFF